MSCAQCKGIAQEFDDRLARRELRRYRRRGPSATARRLLGALRGAGIQGASFIDVGGGVVDASTSRAVRLLGLVIPREHLPMRLAFRVINAVQRLRRRPFNVFLHGTAAVEARARMRGFHKLLHADTPFWQIHLYIKDGGPRAAP
ncbi:MAG: hypothetical protein Q8N53_13850 [Longimicrobiales bacterium]|nr:hypothetical protein [Longimicrobiales bacterium]